MVPNPLMEADDINWRYRSHAFITLRYKHAFPRPNTPDSDYSLFMASAHGVLSPSRFYTTLIRKGDAGSCSGLNLLTGGKEKIKLQRNR